MEALGGFSGGLLLLTDWIWDDEYDADHTARYREAINDSRSLGEVPGFLFAPDNLQAAPELMAFVIERSLTARFYLATRLTVLHLCAGSRVHLSTRDPVVEHLVHARLTTPGASC